MIYYKSGLVYARDAKVEDIAQLKDHLRKTTVDEIKTLYDYTPEQSLFYSFTNSTFKYSIVHDEEVIAMGGIYQPADAIAQKARLWFLSSQKLDNVERSFLRQCKNFMGTMLEMYPLLYNFVNVDNKPAVTWLKWIGAKFGDTIYVKGLNLKYFEFTRNN